MITSIPCQSSATEEQSTRRDPRELAGHQGICCIHGLDLALSVHASQTRPVIGQPVVLPKSGKESISFDGQGLWIWRGKRKTRAASPLFITNTESCLFVVRDESSLSTTRHTFRVVVAGESEMHRDLVNSSPCVFVCSNVFPCSICHSFIGNKTSAWIHARSLG